MNIAIVDDMASDRLRLEHILKDYSTLHQLDLTADHFESGESLLAVYQPYQYAIVFLDIYFADGITGIRTAELLRAVDEDAKLVFLTTSEAHRPEAFSLFATSYIVKPCTEEQVFRVLDHLFRIKTGAEQRFSFSYGRREYSLSYADIVSLQTDGNYLSIMDKAGKTFRTRMTFSAAESQLDSRFLTLMKGIVVNMDYILQMTDDRCILKGGTVFPVHVKRQKELKQKWLTYKFARIREESAWLGANHVH